MPQQGGQTPEIPRRQDQPGRPAPGLVGTPDADIENQPVQPAGGDMRPTHAVQLPRARDRQVAGLEDQILAIDAEGKPSALEERQFEALVPVPVETPILGMVRVPEASK